MSTLSTNPQLELAYEYVQYTNQNIFLTGKAGTGKTTFLRRIKEESQKRLAVVAPTGVAAINARGTTIHSLFQLPFGPFVPGITDLNKGRKFTKKKINLIRSLDLLIIDEISMVRCDVLDAIDEVLRRYKAPHLPFGGLQLLMIGDLHQLPPVVRQEQWQLLQHHYPTPYFFGSQALRRTQPVVIQLTHIFRQSDQVFIDLLNKVRDNQLDQSVLDALNSRYRPNFSAKEAEGYITLTSHNRTAQETNEKQLAALAGNVQTFDAKIDGDFPEHAYPTLEKLEFKVEAQVMFIKNDPSPEKLFYNGKIGRITKIMEDAIYVQCPGEPKPIWVQPTDWENVKYELNESSKKVEEKVVGTFTQYPLKLAWAITIHKSQGLTFERAIIDAQAAFAHGQVYVALSRCKTFEGIVLRSPIRFSSVKTDSVVKNYSKDAEQNAPDHQHLQQSKHQFQQDLILELFQFEAVQKAIQRVERTYFEHENILTSIALQQVRHWQVQVQQLVIEVALRFQLQLQRFFAEATLPEENGALQTRIQKASVYFLEQIQQKLMPELEKIPTVTDNKKVSEQAVERLKALEKLLFVKQKCLIAAKEKFVAQNYLQIRANAELDFDKKALRQSVSKVFRAAPQSSPHPDLYQKINSWRMEVAMELSKNSFDILPMQSLLDLTKILPTTKANLLKIKGIGKVKVDNYGLSIISIIQQYCKDNLIESDQLQAITLDKSDTKYQSFDLFQSGKSIDEIMLTRNLSRPTIEGHLAYFVERGKLSVFKVMEQATVTEIKAHWEQHPQKSSKDVKIYFGEKYTYQDLKLVRAHMQYLEEKRTKSA